MSMKWTKDHTKMLVLTHKSTPAEEIGKILGVSVRTVQWTQAKPEFRQKLESMADKVAQKLLQETNTEVDSLSKARDELQKCALTMARKLKRLAKKGESKDRLQLDACKDILDRAGLKPVEVIETRERQYSPEEIQSALSAIKELEHLTLRLGKQDSKFVISDKTPKVPITDEGTKQTGPDRPAPLPT